MLIYSRYNYLITNFLFKKETEANFETAEQYKALILKFKNNK